MSGSESDTPARPARASKHRQSDQSDNEDSNDGSTSPRDKKRVKLEIKANNARNKQRAGEERDQEEEEGPRPARKGKRSVVQDEEDEEMDEQDNGGADDDDEEEVKQQLVRDADGYVTGSIVRIACHSFLTYDSVEFRPGPALNMIIGPNGTGKSTIACAIAIGLGFPAKVLGRSTKLSAYCKNDSTEETWIELELKGHPGEKNLIVRRYLSRDSERSKFEIDGEEVSAKDVIEKMEELQVQVANLCTFLPQDRVAAFAMMTASERLRETQKAAGHRNLNAWHDVLIKEGKTCKAAQVEVDRHAEELKRMETKQAETEKEVRAFEQRERLQDEMAVIDVLIAFAEYNDTFDKFQRAKEKRTRIGNEIAELENRYRPFRDSKAALEQIVKACHAEQNSLDKKVQRAIKDAEDKKKSLTKADGERDTINEQLQTINKEAKERKAMLAKHKEDIQKYQSLVEDEPPEPNTEAIALQIRDKTVAKNEISTEANSRKAERDNVMHRANQIKNHILNDERDLEHMKQAGRVRELACEKYDLPTWRAVQWLRQNRQMFKGTVYEPARLNVFIKQEWNGRKLNVKDEELVNMIEGPISMGNFSTFLFEYQEDYDLMYRTIHDEPNRAQPGTGIRINGSVIDRNWRLADMPRSLNQEQLNRLGFDAMAIDFLDGPEAVLCYLADASNLTKVPLQINRRALATEDIERIRSLQRYYTRDGSNSVKYSSYGGKFAQHDFRALNRAKILNSTVDQNRIKNLQQRIDQGQEQRLKLKEDYDRLKREEDDLSAQVDQLEQEREELQKEKIQMGKARQHWLKAKSRLETIKRNYDKLKAKPSEADRRTALNTQLRKIMDKRVRYALEYKDLIMRAADLLESSIKVNLQALQAENDKRAMDVMTEERDEEIEAKKQEQVTVQAEYAMLVQQGKHLKAVAEERINSLSSDLRDRVETRREEDIPLAQLQDEKTDIETNLNCMQAVSPAVLEAFKKRQREIADLREKFEGAEERLNESKEVINTTESRWLPKLEKLVQDVSIKFSTYFDTLGLLGEVRLLKDDDYERWGIGIFVRFRDPKDKSGDVQLHELSGHRQSGGERALTTVTYLLALAELARAPFALVDEINQGMDQRAERNMHKMLVETTCSHDVGQYFLLTPKLLPDLVYHPKMKVLVINVSPWIPGNLSLEKILNRKRKLLRQKAVAAA
ncbi:hypothetical protein JCM10908_002752 [Rhodotorula pacifica]|uniref:DNA repair ATPase SMC5 n=1 Tax=Rhodotorula pacifica TaxID=1495444 RepID=UPI00317A85F7